MNQGKLEVVKQEMARVNVDILGIRELKWTGMGEWARIPWKKWSSHHTQQESEMQYLDTVSKMREWSLHFQGKPFNITVIQVYAPTSNTEEAERVYEDLQDLLELTLKKYVLFIIEDWNATVGIKKHLE